MTLLAAVSMLVAVLAAYTALTFRDRARNLEVLLDDATRTVERQRVAISYHLRESLESEWEIEQLQQRVAYLEACQRQRGAVLAGLLLVGADVAREAQGADAP